ETTGAGGRVDGERHPGRCRGHAEHRDGSRSARRRRARGGATGSRRGSGM
ncbi:MAG: hypothetical protein AVDCRST_MAG66-3274, partial [uncultured Pseudonocardia sp.]